MLASSLREEAQATVSNKPGHRGEHEGNRKTIARGMPGDFRCDRGDYARVLHLPFAREASGAAGARHSLRPLISEDRKFRQTSRGLRGEIAKLCLPSLRGAQATKQSIPCLRHRGLLRFARNDGLNTPECRVLDVATGTKSRSIIRRPCERRDP